MTIPGLKRILAVGGFLLALVYPAAAGPCGVAVLDTYIAPGFTCTTGALQFSNFQWSSDFNSAPGTSANLPTAIMVTPQNGAGGIGFNFGNLGILATGFQDIVADGINFDVTALSGNIVGASLALGGHGAVSDGTDTAFFQDALNNFLLTVVDPIPWTLGGSFYNTVRTTQSSTFTGITSGSIFTGAGAVLNGANGNASIADYTVLLQASAPATNTVPEPGNIGLFGGGLLLLGTFTIVRTRA